jgi:hypothetical protein
MVLQRNGLLLVALILRPGRWHRRQEMPVRTCGLRKSRLPEILLSVNYFSWQVERHQLNWAPKVDHTTSTAHTALDHHIWCSARLNTGHSQTEPSICWQIPPSVEVRSLLGSSKTVSPHGRFALYLPVLN